MNAWSSKRDLGTSPSRCGCCSLFFHNNILAMYLFLSPQECLGDKTQCGLFEAWKPLSASVALFAGKELKVPWGCFEDIYKPQADTLSIDSCLPVENKGGIISKNNCNSLSS